MRNLVSSIKASESGTKCYSDKLRTLFACYDDQGNVLAAVLGTPKRSNMLKLNIVGIASRKAPYDRILSYVIEANQDVRRIYLTVPCNQTECIEALSCKGFAFEGMLENPFNRAVNHACFGLMMPSAM